MNIRRCLSRFYIVAVSLCALAIAGCGGPGYGPTGKITGRLTLDGKPLPPGHAVSFMQREKGFLAFGATDADGKFEVSSFNNGEMPVGKYSVMVGAAPLTSNKPAKEYTADELFENPGLADPPVAPIEFPKKYTDVTTSGLEYEIKAGPNHFDIDLKGEEKPPST